MRSFMHSAGTPRVREARSSTQHESPDRSAVGDGARSMLELHLMAGNQAVGYLLRSGSDAQERQAERVSHGVAFGNAAQAAHVARRSGLEDDAVAAGLQPLPEVRRALSRSGEPLDPATRHVMESRFHEDFSGVRVHADAAATSAAGSISAAAFTVENHIGFAAGRYAPDTNVGGALLAHELTHVVQQGGVRQEGVRGESDTVAPAAPQSVQRAPDTPPDPTLAQLDAILPKRASAAPELGVAELKAMFDPKDLAEHVQLIVDDAAARELTKQRGVPAIMALYDTRRGDKLDVEAAKQALEKNAPAYTKAGLKGLKLASRTEAPSQFWFQDPAKQKDEEFVEGALPKTSSEERKKVFVETVDSELRVNKRSGVHVRFAYPAPDVGTPKVKDAKQAILEAIRQIMTDLTSHPPSALTKDELRTRDERDARLDQVWKSFTVESPLRIYIATDPMDNLTSSQVAAVTDRVFINLEDVGNPAKLQAAIRFPLIVRTGGYGPNLERVPAATPEQMQDMLLHEMIHAMLVQQGSDATSVWQSNSAALKIDGNPIVSSRFTELVRKYLIAQEEVFAYENTAQLYPPVSPHKAEYDLFVGLVRLHLERRGIATKPVVRTIPVSEKVAKKSVSWSVTYQMPRGDVALSISDMTTLDALLSQYPLH